MVVRIVGAFAVAGLIAGRTINFEARADTAWAARMTGSAETPPNDSKGSGTATFSLKGNMLTYTLTAKSLSGTATAAHVHVGKPGVAGPPVFTYALRPSMAGMSMGDTIASGTLDLSKPNTAGVSGDSLKVLLLNGNAYVNVHTALHPMGEIRGQVVKK